MNLTFDLEFTTVALCAHTILGRFVNIAVPFILANLIFVFEEGATSPPWLYLFVYAGLHFLQGNGGLPALLDVSRAHSFFPIFLLHLSLLHPGYLDPCDAILGQWCVARKLQGSGLLLSFLDMSQPSFNLTCFLSPLPGIPSTKRVNSDP
jgi:hypothetical protein